MVKRLHENNLEEGYNAQYEQCMRLLSDAADDISEMLNMRDEIKYISVGADQNASYEDAEFFERFKNTVENISDEAHRAYMFAIQARRYMK